MNITTFETHFSAYAYMNKTYSIRWCWLFLATALHFVIFIYWLTATKDNTFAVLKSSFSSLPWAEATSYWGEFMELLDLEFKNMQYTKNI